MNHAVEWRCLQWIAESEQLARENKPGAHERTRRSFGELLHGGLRRMSPLQRAACVSAGVGAATSAVCFFVCS